MRRTDHIFVYYNPSDDRRYCRICTVTHMAGSNICAKCVKQDNHNYVCCSYATSRDNRWTENFKFDNTIHKILVSTNGCILTSGCNKECSFRDVLKNMYKLMENVDER